MDHAAKFHSTGQNNLSTVSLSGVIVPWTRILGRGRVSAFKLVSNNGLEYPIVPAPEWKDVLSCYSWEEVRVFGLLDSDDLSLIVMRVFPKGPKGEKDFLIDLLSRKGRDLVSKVKKGVNDLILAPAALRLQRAS
jgi:hypothetical protein